MIPDDKTVKVVAWNPLGDERRAQIVEVCVDKHTTLESLFSNIKSTMNVYYLGYYYPELRWETYGNACPYICRNNAVYWNVPYNDISVTDFMKTHDIYNNVIVVEIDCLAGDSGQLFDFLFQGWISLKAFLEYTGYAFTVKEIINLLINAYGKKKRKMPQVESIEKYILSKDVWDIKELVRTTRFTNKMLTAILEEMGYVLHDAKYYKDSWKVAQYMKKKESFDYNEYIANYTGFNMYIDPYWAQALNTSLILHYELCYMVGRIDKHDELEKKIVKMINESANDKCYDLEINMVNAANKKLEEELGISI